MSGSLLTRADVTVYQVVRKEVISDDLTIYWIVPISEHGEESGQTAEHLSEV